MKLLLIFGLIFSFNLFSADNIITPKNRGTVQVLDNVGRVWPALVGYTTDGAGNVIPISSGGGGSGLTDTQLRASAVPVTLSGVGTKTPGLSVVTTSGTVASGARAVSFLVTSAASVTVLGAALAQGESVSFEAPQGFTLGAIAYDATGGTLKIAEVR